MNHIFYYWSPPGSIIAGQQVMGYCLSQVTTALSQSLSLGACHRGLLRPKWALNVPLTGGNRWKYGPSYSVTPEKRP